MPPVVQRIRVSIQISLKMSQGMAPMVFRMPISWNLSQTDVRIVFMTPTMAIRMAMMAIESTMTLAVEMSFMMVSLTCARLTIWTSGSLIELFLQPGAVNPFFQFDADGGDFVGPVEYLLQRLEGHKDGPVILRSRPLQYADHLELDVLLGHEDHVAHLTLFQFGRLKTHDGLVGVFIGKPAALLES